MTTLLEKLDLALDAAEADANRSGSRTWDCMGLIAAAQHASPRLCAMSPDDLRRLYLALRRAMARQHPGA